MRRHSPDDTTIQREEFEHVISLYLEVMIAYIHQLVDFNPIFGNLVRVP